MTLGEKTLVGFLGLVGCIMVGATVYAVTFLKLAAPEESNKGCATRDPSTYCVPADQRVDVLSGLIDTALPPDLDFADFQTGGFQDRFLRTVFIVDTPLKNQIVAGRVADGWAQQVGNPALLQDSFVLAAIEQRAAVAEIDPALIQTFNRGSHHTLILTVLPHPSRADHWFIYVGHFER